MTDRLQQIPPAAAHDASARCCLAIELSKASWLVALVTPLSEKIGIHKLAAGDAAALLELIERAQARVVRALGRPVEVMSCYEAGYDGFWLHRLLGAHGVHNHVFDPASLQVDRRAR